MGTYTASACIPGCVVGTRHTRMQTMWRMVCGHSPGRSGRRPERPSKASAGSEEGRKRQKAHGGCLGVKGRGRTWHTAKSLGEPCAGGEPGMSEWGNPRGRPPRAATRKRSLREPGELKHLSTPRKRNDSPSSGERKGRSPNRPKGRGWRALAERGGAASRRVWEGPPKRVRVP